MKKLLLMALAAFTLITLSQSCKKKLTDEKIGENATAQLAKMADLKGGAVTVKDGVATVTGTCADQACSDRCKKGFEDAKVAGVKSVVWSAALAPVSTVINASIDTKVQQQIKDGLKDIKTVQVAFNGNKAVFTGTCSASQKNTIAQLCMSAKVAPDMTKVTVK